MVVLVTYKNGEDPIKNENTRVLSLLTRFSPIINLRQLSVAIETRVLIRSGPKSKCSFSPTPMMILIKFGCHPLTGCGDIQVLKCSQMDGRTDAGSTGIL